jgi:hypothetical protein
MTSSFFWDVTQRRVDVTGVSGQPISPIFDGPAVTFEDGSKPAFYAMSSQGNPFCVQRTGCEVVH